MKELGELIGGVLGLELDSVPQLVCCLLIQLIPIHESLEHVHFLFNLRFGLIKGVDDGGETSCRK